MAADLLSKIHDEIDERLGELRPLLAEYEGLLVAADALVVAGRDSATSAETAVAPAKRLGSTRVARTRRGSAEGAIRRAAVGPSEAELDGEEHVDATHLETTDIEPSVSLRRSIAKPRQERAVRGAAREAILGALEHGSHTVGELAVVTAMSGPNINGNLRRLLAEGVVVKAEREGKSAWALADPAA
jgi:hypothetical protein